MDMTNTEFKKITSEYPEDVLGSDLWKLQLSIKSDEKTIY